MPGFCRRYRWFLLAATLASVVLLWVDLSPEGLTRHQYDRITNGMRLTEAKAILVQPAWWTDSHWEDNYYDVLYEQDPPLPPGSPLPHIREWRTDRDMVALSFVDDRIVRKEWWRKSTARSAGSVSGSPGCGGWWKPNYPHLQRPDQAGDNTAKVAVLLAVKRHVEESPKRATFQNGTTGHRLATGCGCRVKGGMWPLWQGGVERRENLASPRERIRARQRTARSIFEQLLQGVNGGGGAIFLLQALSD